MNSKVREHLLSVTLLLTLLLGGCAPAGTPILDGQVLELGIGATARGLGLALSGTPGTHMITDGELLFAIWPQGDIWGGACINCGVADPLGQWRYLTGGRGMAMTAKTTSEMVRYLVEEHGWTAIPAAVARTMQPYTMVLSQMSTSLTGFLVIPAGMMLPPELAEKPQT